MNILVLSWRDLKHPLAGGAEQVMHEHMKGWIAEGNSVTFFSSKFPNALQEEEIDKVKIIRHGSQYLTCHIAAFFWYLFGTHPKFDLVVDEFHGWPFFTPLYVRNKKLAVIQEITKQVWFEYPLPYKLNLLLGMIGYVLEPLFFVPYRNVKFMTGSNSARDELKTVGIKDKNITVVPHGVILDLPKKLPKREKVGTIIFLGALAKDKGIEDAIKVFSILNKKGNYQFWIVGKSDINYLQFLEKEAQRLEIKNKTKFFGFVDQKQKFELLARANIMINPSIREGWGLVNIEANAVGTPVVAYNSPGLIDSVKNNLSGIIVSKNTPEEIAETVFGLLNNKDKYSNLQKGAISWSKQFSWDNSRQKSLKLINSLK